MRVRWLPLAALLLVVVAGAVASPATVMLLAPALALLGLLLAGRAPGEELILRRLGALPRARRRVVRFAGSRYRVLFVRFSSRMSASALAMRPPPVRLASFG